MSTLQIILLITAISVSTLITTFKVKGDHKNRRYIDMPEEIEAAQTGDTLYIIKSTQDTLYLGYRK